MSLLTIKNLQAQTEGKTILRGLNLEIKSGEIHVLMGPNGSGKSTLAKILLGHPAYEVTKGSLRFAKKDLQTLSPEKRAQLGLFLAFQYPEEIAGVTVASFLRLAYNNLGKLKDKDFKELRVPAFRKLLLAKMKQLQINPELADRYLNEGFSGGEKKKMEMLQALILEPKLAILDEIDSGLDVDALKIVSDGIKTLHEQGMAVLLVTHYERLLNYISADRVHIMLDGKIVKSGDKSLAKNLLAEGFDAVRRELEPSKGLGIL